MIELILTSGVKNGKKWYALKIKHTYDSGKSFTKIGDFLTEKEYNQLKEKMTEKK